MRRRALFTQVLALNGALVCLAALFAATLAGLELSETARVVLVIVSAGAISIFVNLAVLRRRFTPLERLIEEMEKVDLSRPGANLPPSIDGQAETEEVERIELAFMRMMRRLEAERRRAGTVALRAQEEERTRLARDLHDEVNQALTAILLRLEALAQDSPVESVDEVNELKRLVNQAMEELLNLARQLRPSALDDHGLMPAVETQLKRFSARTAIEVSLNAEGDPDSLPEDVQTAVYRILQEALANIGRHAGATAVSVDIEADDEHLELRIRDDGEGFDPAALTRASMGDGPGAGLGLSGMAERARLANGELDVRSAPGGGTTVTMRIARLQRAA